MRKADPIQRDVAWVTGGKGVLPSLVGVPAIFFRLVAAGPSWTYYVFRQRLSPVDSSRPTLTRQANGRAGASREGGAPTG